MEMITRHSEKQAETQDERDADRWLKSIDVRATRKARAIQEAEWAAEDADPSLQSTRRIWEAIIQPSRFVQRGKTPQQIEREAQRKARAAANLLIDDPMLWR
jgi:hypothetical protein